MSVMCFFESGKEWPTKSNWNGLPVGRYIESRRYLEDRFVILDTYGKEVAVFERKPNP